MPAPVLPRPPPDPAAIRRAAEVIRAGGLVAFPTETVYGLGANALDAGGSGEMFAAKGRPATNPLIVHVADESQANAIAAEWPEAARKLAAAFWPGPLTLVVPRHAGVPEAVTAGGLTVAVRCPAHPVAAVADPGGRGAARGPERQPLRRAVAQRGPSTSQGWTGRPDPRRRPVPRRHRIDGRGRDRPIVRLLRPGPITVAQLEAVVGRVDVVSGGRGRTAAVAGDAGPALRPADPAGVGRE